MCRVRAPARGKEIGMATRGGVETIDIVLVHGGFVDGSGWDCKWKPEDIAETIKRIPLGRAGRPEDYAEVIFFLLAGAGYVSGETIVVDGGGTG